MKPKAPDAPVASEFIMLGSLIMILLVMVLPLPSVMLDVLLTFSIAFSLAVLLVAMYTRKPVEFSVFPPLLLLVTLGRLALNVASTRLILLDGFAGDVIETFGKFVVGGNFVVGLIIFLILILIQFVVITNGAGRVAEVAARFTLDAMPGKQMSIDADLASGAITQEEAQARRREIEREADFYGAMDGAAKFVKGDAIASVVITSINVVGGFFVGVFQRGLPLMEAVERYSILTIGDGLVGQISALLVSTATGLIVTRAASESHLGAEVSREILVQPQTINRIGWILCGFALVPGLPKIPFLVLGGVAIHTSRKLRAQELAADIAPPEAPAEDGPEDVGQFLELEPVELAIGYALVALVDKQADGELLERVVGVRRSLAKQMGVIVPPIRIRDDLSLRPGQYEIRFYGEAVSEGEVYPGRYLAMAHGPEPDLPGLKVNEPAFGLPAVWIEATDRERAELEGAMVIDPASVIATHLSEGLKKHSGELLGRQEVQLLLERVRAHSPKLVDESVPSPVSLGLLRQVLVNLLREGVSIRDLRRILECCADHAGQCADASALTEKVREGLGRSLLGPHLSPGHKLVAAALSPNTEALVERVLPGGEGLAPEQLRSVIESINQGANQIVNRGHQPALVTSQRVRPLVKRMTERTLPLLPVFSYEELPREVVLETVALVETGEPR